MNALITFPAVAGAIVTVATAIINRVNWSAKIKNLVALVIGVLLVAGGVLAELYPDKWQIIASGILASYGVSQAIYAALKTPLQRLEAATSGGTITVDIGDLLAEVDADLQPIRSYYLGDQEAARKAAEAVANQAKNR